MTDYFNPQPKEPTYKVPEYRQFIQAHPCCVCGNPETDWHHVQEEYHGKMGGKESDFQTVPLCFNHHLGDEGIHTIGRKEFYKRFKINFYKVMFKLLKKWIENGKKVY